MLCIGSVSNKKGCELYLFMQHREIQRSKSIEGEKYAQKLGHAVEVVGAAGKYFVSIKNFAGI